MSSTIHHAQMIDGRLWVRADSHAQAVELSYEAGRQVGMHQEREACAKIADRHHVPMCDTSADAIAHEIRARSTP